MLVGALALLVAVPLASWQAPALAADPAETVTTLDISPPDPELGDTIQVVATVDRADQQATDVLGQVRFSVAPDTADLWETDVAFGPASLTQGVGTVVIDLDETELPFLDDEPDAIYLSARYEPVDGQQSYSDEFADSESETVCIDLSGAGCDSITTTTMVTGPSTAVAGAATSLTASVSPAGAAGTVQFSVDGSPVGAPATVASGVATLSHTFQSAGVSTVRATFTPTDPGAYAGSADATGQAVSVYAPAPAAIPTTTSVGGPSSATVGTPATFTATVTPAAAAGAVQFSVDGVTAGAPVPVAGGTATLVHTFGAAGVSTVRATFTPADPAAYETSTSASGLDVDVTASESTVQLAGPGRVTAGALVEFTASVTPVGVPGSVTFRFENRRSVAVAVDAAGRAAASHRFLSMGSSSVTATWEPADATHEAASAPPHAVEVAAGGSAAEFAEYLTASFGSLTFDLSCGTGRTAKATTPDEFLFSALFNLTNMVFDLIRELFATISVSFKAVFCAGGPGGRAEVVRGTVDCEVTDEGLACPFDLTGLSQLTITGSLPVPAELAGTSQGVGATLSSVDPETGELTPVASDESTIRVPERTVLSASLAPVPRDLTWVAHRDVVAYRLTVRNAGVVAADRVRACIRVDKASEIVTAKGADVRGSRACWTLPSLTKAESLSRRVTLVTPTRGTSMKVVATVTPQRRQADPVRLAARLPVR